MENPNPITHIARSIFYGDWTCGWATRKSWPTKRRFGWFADYYDGWHWAFHIGPFYVGASY